MSDTGYPTLDPAIYGCVDAEQYSYTKRVAATRANVVRGRPRTRLKDTYAAYIFNAQVRMTASQFSMWQAFWTTETDRGLSPFVMSLMFSTAPPEPYVVQAVEQWSGALGVDGVWTVTLRFEAPGGIAVAGTICDVIYGGPIYDPATDVIWAGTPSSLPPDVIEPCPGVQP